MKKQTTAKLLLLALMSQTIICSCESGKQTDNTSDDANDNSSENTEIVEKDPNDDNLPDNLDFGGKEFRVLTYQNGNMPSGSNEWPNYITVETENGDLVNDAAYLRNREVEERLNVKITCQEVTGMDIRTTLSTSTLAGFDEYDLAVGLYDPLIELFRANVFLDVSSTEYIDLSKPYYVQSASDTYRYGDKRFVFAGKYPYPAFASVLLLFNKQRWDEYSLEDPYELVESGKWTLDKMNEIVSDKYIDLNSNSSMDIDDFYGMSAFDIVYNYFYFSCGCSVVEAVDNGYSYGMNTERSADVMTKLVSLVRSQDTFEANWRDNSVRYKNFTDGNSLLCLYTSSFWALRDIDFDFGILPLPKYDEAQDNYITYQIRTLCGIPSTVEDTAFVSAVTEALFSSSAKHMDEPFIKKFVENKLLRDDGSQRMYKLMTETAKFEMTRIIDPTGGLISDMKPISDMISERSSNVASKWASIEKQVKEAYDGLTAEAAG